MIKGSKFDEKSTNFLIEQKIRSILSINKDIEVNIKYNRSIVRKS